ncbi:unnamed protein product, partial [Polarella glacialis]
DGVLFAAGEGNLEAVQKALAAGEDVNFRSEAGETPLHVSGIRCVKEVVRELLAAGAEVNAQTEAGKVLLPVGVAVVAAVAVVVVAVVLV